MAIDASTGAQPDTSPTHWRQFDIYLSDRRCTVGGQLYLPQAMIAARALDPEALLAGRMTPALRALLADLRTIARQHLAEAERDIADLAPPVNAAFLPLKLVNPYLERMDRANYDPFSGAVELAPWRRQWILWRAARRM